MTAFWVATFIISTTPMQRFFHFLDSLKSAECEFIEVVQYTDMDFERVFTGQAYLLAPNRLRVDFISPQEQTLILTDSAYILTSANGKKIVKREFNFLLPKNSEELRKKFRIRQSETDSSYLFTITPSQDNYIGEVMVEFAKDDFKPLSLTIFEMGTQMHYSFRNLKLNSEIADSLFFIAEE